MKKRSKFYETVHRTVSDEKSSIVFTNDQRPDGQNIFVLIAFPKEDHEVDDMTRFMMEKAIEVYQLTNCPVKGFVFVEDDNLSYYSIEIKDMIRRELFSDDKVSIQIYNTAIMPLLLESALVDGDFLSNLQIFMYAYYMDIDDKLLEVATAKQTEFLERNWDTVFDDASELNLLVSFILSRNDCFH